MFFCIVVMTGASIGYSMLLLVVGRPYTQANSTHVLLLVKRKTRTQANMTRMGECIYTS
jgi:hypothetical protein